MQFGFRFQILLFTTSARFSTTTLTYKAYEAYKAYKAFRVFMAFKRSRLNPFQNYHSITSFSVDWPRLNAPGNRNPNTLEYITTDKSFISKNLVIRHVTRPCPCMITSIIIKITRVISMWTPHWITVSCHGLEGPMTTGYYCAIFLFCGGGKKKMTTKKQGILWLGYHRYPSKNPRRV